ncbi:hypothetical protein lerEdw1_003936, partial [Lerista edwardsae]
HQAHVVTRDPTSEKTSPVLPPQPDISIEDESFKPKGRMSKHDEITVNISPLCQSSEKNYKPDKYGDKAKDECYYNADSRISGCEPFPIPMPVCGIICKRTIKKTKDTLPLGRTWMHFLCEDHEFQILLRPDRRCSSVDEVQGEIQLRSRWISEAHRMRRDVGQFEEDEDDADEDEEDQQADEEIVNERKKGYKGVAGHQKKQYGRKSKTLKDEFESRDSSSSSSSSSSSALLGFAVKKQVKQKGESTSSDSSSGDSSDSTSSSDSSKSDSGSSSSDSTSSDSTSSSESKSAGQRGGRHTTKDSSSSSSGDRNDDSSSSDSDSDSSSDSSDDSSSSSDSDSSSDSSSSDSDSSSDSSSSDSDSSDSDDSDSNSSSESDEMPRKKGTPREIYEFRFVAYKEQKHSRQQEVTSGSRSSSDSSDSNESSSSSSRSRPSSSSEEDQADYQKKKLPEVLVARLMGLRNDKPVQGYEATLYESFSAVQIMVRDIAEPGKPTVTCIDAEITENKLWFSLRAGRDCRQYAVSAALRAGTFGDYPALQLKVEYPKVPACVESIARDFYELIPGIAFMMGLTQKEQRNPPRQFELITALDDPLSCIVVMRMPKEVYYTTDCYLPWPVPVTQPIHISQLLDAPSLVLANLNGVCSVNSFDHIKTFNGKETIIPPTPECYHILVRLDNDENKLLVMTRPQMDNSKNKHLRIHLANTEIIFEKIGAVYKVYVNDTEISKFPFIDQTEAGSLFTIENANNSLALIAPKSGLLALNYDGPNIMIKVLPWLAGKLRGNCGSFDAETEKEFRTPTGYIAKDAMSFVQSWVADSTTKYGDCKLKHTAVEIDGIQLRGQSSKCSPIVPVLRCKEGCSATATTSNRVPMHCVSSDSTMTLASRKKAEKAEDLMYDVESHRSCSCDV